jgi:hypothetical protein
MKKTSAIFRSSQNKIKYKINLNKIYKIKFSSIFLCTGLIKTHGSKRNTQNGFKKKLRLVFGMRFSLKMSFFNEMDYIM